MISTAKTAKTTTMISTAKTAKTTTMISTATTAKTTTMIIRFIVLPKFESTESSIGGT